MKTMHKHSPCRVAEKHYIGVAFAAFSLAGNGVP